MSATVIPFPRPRRRPNVVEVQFYSGQWTIAYFQDQRFVSRLDLLSKASAEAEAKRLAKSGMTWRKEKNGTIYIMPDCTEGGCWAVVHCSRSENSDSLLGRHMCLDDAINHATRAARETGAELSLSDGLDDRGGAA